VISCAQPLKHHLPRICISLSLPLTLHSVLYVFCCIPNSLSLAERESFLLHLRFYRPPTRLLEAKEENKASFSTCCFLSTDYLLPFHSLFYRNSYITSFISIICTSAFPARFRVQLPPRLFVCVLNIKQDKKMPSTPNK